MLKKYKMTLLDQVNILSPTKQKALFCYNPGGIR